MITAILLLAASSAAGADTGFRIDPAHTGRAGVELAGKPVKLWERQFADVEYVVTPVVVGSRTFVGAGGRVVALDSRSGAVLWELATDADPHRVHLAFGGGRLIAKNDAGWVYALDPATGRVLWKDVRGDGTSPPTVSGGKVFVHADGAGVNDPPGVTAYDLADGDVLWHAEAVFTAGDGTAPTVGGGRVFVTGACGHTYAFDEDSGDELWHHEGPCWGGGGSTSVLYRNRLYLTEPNHQYILDAATGAELGHVEPWYPSFLGDMGFFVVGEYDERLEARDMDDGTLRWSRSVTPPDWIGPKFALLSGRTSYWVAGGKDLLALETATGRVVSRTRVGADPHATVGELHTDGTTLAATVDKGVAAFALTSSGYWMLRADGHVYPFGGVAGHGAVTGIDAVNVAATPSGRGYWVTTRQGAVYAYGDAPHLGGLPPLAPGEEVTTIAGLPTGGGYWLFTNRGRAFAYGKAQHLGDMAGTPLNGGVVASAATASGKGYLMAAADGGVFAFGDAGFLGSMGGTPLNQPVVGAAADPDGKGYWLIAADGGIFAFDAVFKGSMGGTPLNKPVVGGVPFGDGYLMTASDGGVFNFSTEPFAGSLGSSPPPLPIVAITSFAA